MNKVLILAFATILLLTACNKKAEAKPEAAVKKDSASCSKPAGKEFKMYEMSEMAALMEQMYVDNLRLKERITKGDIIGTFPQHILKIHSSAMTDESENDAFFKLQAAKFIKAQEQIYNDPKNAKQHFNDAVTACVKCHQGKCDGPIPRIKKLYIK
jgi:cytochrome c553